MYRVLKQTTALALIFGLLATGSQAQVFDENGADESATVLDRITVTARRTEEDIQNVPGSVVVIGDERLEDSNASDGRDVFLQLPNVSFIESSNPVDTGISIRGLSNLVGGNNASGPTVGVFIDGALVNPTGQSTGVNPNLIDVERVETIFGPQGTAFGRGTIGGAVNFVTKKPTDEVEGSITTEFSSFTNVDALDVLGKVVLNAPILEDGLLSARFAGYGSDSDGFLELINNVTDDTNEIDEFGGRLSLRSRPTDQITLDLSATYDRSTFVTSNSVTSASFAAGDPVNIDNFFGNDQVFERELYSLNGEFELDGGVFNSNTSYFSTEFDSSVDTDRLPIDLLQGSSFSEQTSLSQEFRYESNEFDAGILGGEASFNMGASAAVADFDQFFTLDPNAPILGAILPGVQAGLAQAQAGLAAAQAGLAAAQAQAAAIVAGGGVVPPALAQQIAILTQTVATLTQTVAALTAQEAQLIGLINAAPINPGFVEATLGGSGTNIEQEVESFSIFGDLRWQPTDQLEVAVGARYSRDTVFVGTQTESTGLVEAQFIPDLARLEGEATFDAITPNASIRYEWNDYFTTYASYATGFRAGGFSATFAGLNEFDEETVQSYEIGFRSSLLENTLILSASAFYIDYDDIQLVIAGLQPAAPGSPLNLPVSTVQNAGSARSVGAEIGVNYTPFDGLVIDAKLGLLSAEFAEDVTQINAAGAVEILAQEGDNLPNAPDTTFSIVVDYELQEPVPGLDAYPFIRGEYSYRSDFTNLVNTNSVDLDGFDLFNLRAGLRSDTFEITAFAENLFDEIYATGTTSVGAAGLLTTAPDVNLDIGARRRYGVIGKFKF